MMNNKIGVNNHDEYKDLVYKYIDRMNDPACEAEQILVEFTNAFDELERPGISRRPPTPEKTKAKFRVYDTVWKMQNNSPKELMIFAVVESMDYSKTGTEFLYHVVNGKCGAGWGNNEGHAAQEDQVFKTKEDLVASL